MSKFAIALVLLAIAAPVVPAAAQEFCFEYPSGVYDPTWVLEERVEWHQVVPVYCEWFEQTGHDDANSNGRIDACEHIFFNGERYHVDWIGPTYKLVSIADPSEVRLVEDHEPGGQPFLYHEVYPTFCNTIETDAPLTQVCQEMEVLFPPEDAGFWHVEEINTNIRATADPMSPVEDSTWGKIKNFFQSIGDAF